MKGVVLDSVAEAPPVLAVKGDYYKGYQVEITQEVLDWVAAAEKYLALFGFTVHPVHTTPPSVGWMDSPSNSETFLSASLVLGKDKTVSEIEDEFEFEVSAQFWKCDVGKDKSKWELRYSWSYPFHDRMLKVLVGWQDIKARAIDGEDYSGVLLVGSDTMALTKTNLVDVVDTKLTRVRNLYKYMDEILG